MLSWIALAVSIISLIVNIVVQRDKLQSGMDELRRWKEKRTIKKQGGRFVKSIATPAPRSQPNLALRIAFVSLNFSFSLISSAILSLVSEPTYHWFALAVIALFIYVIVSGIVMVLVLATTNGFIPEGIKLLFLMTFGIGVTWVGLTVILISLLGVPILFAGFASAMFNSLADRLVAITQKEHE